MIVYENGGTYLAKIIKWGFSEASTGNPQIFFNCQIEGEKKGEELLDCPKYERTVFLPMTDASIGFTVTKLQKLGYDRPTFDDLDPDSANPFDFADKEVLLRCKHDEYKGKTNEKWDFAGGGFQGKPVEKSKVSKLNAAFGHFLAGGAKAPPAPSRPARAAAPAATSNATGSNEEIY